MSVDVTETIDPVAIEIAKKLKDIREAEREKIVLQNKLDAICEEKNNLRERINRLDAIITSTKYEITNSMFESCSLSLVKKSE
jgi:hypothetical protein